MGTPRNSIMKTLKFFTAFGILCILGSINAQSWEPRSTSEPEPETTSHYHGEQPIEINPIENNFCYTKRECRNGFRGKKGGVCVNMREVSMKEIGKLVHKNHEAKGACGKVDEGNDCCRCFKNRCKQTKACKKRKGICRMGKSPNDPIGPWFDLCDGNCGCYVEK